MPNPGQAQVRSVDALEAFRASLLVYLEKVRPLVDEISSDLRRTLLWMESDRRVHWEREVRRRTQALEQAQQALLSARLATFREATMVEQQAVHNARRALDDAEEKLRRLRRWVLEFGPRTDALARQLNALDSVLHQDLPKAVARLTELIGHLQAYAALRGSDGVAAAASPLEDAIAIETKPATGTPPRRAFHPEIRRFRRMNPSSVRTQLMSLTHELAVRWQETAESWTDVKRDEFQHQFLDPLWTAVDRAGNALERLDEIITTARHDCE